MKILLYTACIILVVFTSCRTNAPVNTPNSFIKYKVNGQQLEVDIDYANISVNTTGFVDCSRVDDNGFPYIFYDLESENISNGNAIGLCMVTDSLTIGNYHYDSAFVANNEVISEGLSINGTPSLVARNGDYIDVNVTAYSKGYISGNFTGKMTLSTNEFYGAAGTTLITNGQFQNISITY